MELSKEYLAMKAQNAKQAKPTAEPNTEMKSLLGIGKRVKHVLIEATFPELKGGQMYQSAHGEASGTKPAIARAFRELLKKIPGKRVSIISARISITTKTVEG